MSKSITAAVIQQAVDGNNKEQNLDRSEALVREAVEQGAELVVLQEIHATQYFCQVEDTECFDLAEPLDGYT